MFHHNIRLGCYWVEDFRIPWIHLSSVGSWKFRIKENARGNSTDEIIFILEHKSNKLNNLPFSLFLLLPSRGPMTTNRFTLVLACSIRSITHHASHCAIIEHACSDFYKNALLPPCRSTSVDNGNALDMLIQIHRAWRRLGMGSAGDRDLEILYESSSRSAELEQFVDRCEFIFFCWGHLLHSWWRLIRVRRFKVNFVVMVRLVRCDGWNLFLIKVLGQLFIDVAWNIF